MQVIQNADKPPKFPPQISKHCRDFLKYCFNFLPEKRADVASLLQHPWLMIADHETLKKSAAASSHMINSLSASHNLVMGHVYDQQAYS